MNADPASELPLSLNRTNEFFHRAFNSSELRLFSRYYQMVLKWNPRLHLTTITPPAEFAVRFILESAFALQMLSDCIEEIWDIGSGAGFPGIPFAIMRPDIKLYLIESNQKKAVFLKEVASELELRQVQIINRRFQDIGQRGENFCVTSRALEKFSDLLPEMLKSFPTAAQLLFFGTEILFQSIPETQKLTLTTTIFPIPRAEKRCLLSLIRST